MAMKRTTPPLIPGGRGEASCDPASASHATNAVAKGALTRSSGSAVYPLPSASSFLSRSREELNFAHIGPAAETSVVPPPFIAHRGSLCRVHETPSSSSPPSAQSSSAAASSLALSYVYAIEIAVDGSDAFGGCELSSYELRFERQQYEFMSSLFAIVDTESRGSVGQSEVMEFVLLRCPVFRRRDDALRKLADSGQLFEMGGNGIMSCPVVDGVDWESTSPTFDEVWSSVVWCSQTPPAAHAASSAEIGVEGWMVFCRFIALAQYQEAKRRFSARHLQQTMRHRNAPRGSEVVVIDVPPPEPPAPLSARELVEHETKAKSAMPLPELDLDHCLVSAHENSNLSPSRRSSSTRLRPGRATISLFGSATASPLLSSAKSSSSLPAPTLLEFTVSYCTSADVEEFTPRETRSPKASADPDPVIVRRSFQDMEWLNDTFTSHRALGGTLCGRILPPFPRPSADGDPSSPSTAGGGTGGGKMAMAAAAAGVGMITSMAKTLWGSYVSPVASTPSSSLPASAPPHSTPSGRKAPPLGVSKSGGARAARHHGRHVGESHHQVNSPQGKARQLERYLNYLLEHPALSTSFPLNTILKASQSGIDAAKRILDEHAKSQRQRRSHSPQLDDGKMSLMFWPSSLSSPNLSGGPSTSQQLNLSWVRTAAQAAMALKVHGILETTGCPSASARLQHASLPSFGPGSALRDEDGGGEGGRSLSGASSRGRMGDDDRGVASGGPAADNEEESDSFERGVVQVESELDTGNGTGDGIFDAEDDGYDMLPLPVPAPERRILNTVASDDADETGSNAQGMELRSSNAAGGSVRFYYGAPSRRRRPTPGGEMDDDNALLGDMSVDDDIDKLREIIGSVDNTLARCLAASVAIGKSRRKREALHIELVRGLDSWVGMRGQIIAQRALLKGVNALERSRELLDEGDSALSEDLSWQASLSTSAVSAAEDVRSAVRASRTAANAKLAAEAAAMTAQKACETGKFSSVDEARAAQTRASISQSHAIHSAVVEHEAMAAKRRAALALAHDVKCWNIHRKREILTSCRAAALSQREACLQAANAWSQLLDGFLGSTVVPLSDEKRVSRRRWPRGFQREDPGESSSVVFASASRGLGGKSSKKPLIVPVDHAALMKDPKAPSPTHSPTEALLFPAVLGSENEAVHETSATDASDDPPCPEPIGEGGDKASVEARQSQENEVPEEPKPCQEKDEHPGTQAQSLGEGPFTVLHTSTELTELEEDRELSFCSLPAEPFAQPMTTAENQDKETPPDAPLLATTDTKQVDQHPASAAPVESPPFAEQEDEEAPFDFSTFTTPVSSPEKSAKEPLLISPVLQSSREEEENLPPSVALEQEEQESPIAPSDPTTSQCEDAGAEGADGCDENELMTASMQSLVDGLMSWGGQYDPDDDLNLPNGMAASIALEESGILRSDG